MYMYFDICRYHHLSVLISVFYCFSNFTPYVRWFMVMNYMVHSVMYSYYTLKALRSLPQTWMIFVLIFLIAGSKCHGALLQS